MNTPSSSDSSASCGTVVPSFCLTAAWFAFLHKPSEETFKQLDHEIEMTLYRLLRPRMLGGFFDSLELDILHEVQLLLLDRFLVGNRKLIAATKASKQTETGLQLMRSVWLAMQATVWRMRRNKVEVTRASLRLRSPAVTHGMQFEVRKQFGYVSLRRAVGRMGYGKRRRQG